MAIDTEARSSRRNILLAALGGAGAALATRLGAPAAARAADGDAVTVGGTFTGSSTTTIDTSAPIGVTAIAGASGDGFGLHGTAGNGNGVVGGSNHGTGVVGTSSTGPGVTGSSDGSTGVIGRSPDPTPSTFTSPSNRAGVLASAGDIGTPGAPGGIADNTDETGVYGFANLSAGSTGVWGDTWDGNGVVGTGDYGLWGARRFGRRLRRDLR